MFSATCVCSSTPGCSSSSRPASSSWRSVDVGAKRGVTAYSNRSRPCQRSISAALSLVARFRRVAQKLGAIAVHQHLAGGDAHSARAGRLEDRIDRCRVHRREDHRGRRAVAQKLVEEERRDLARVRRIREAAFRRERVEVEPFEKLLAVRRDDVRLRVMDVRVDEARQDQPAPVVDDGSSLRAANSRTADQSPVSTTRPSRTTSTPSS